MTTDLKTNISDFVKQFGCVTMPQIRFMFRSNSQEAVGWFVKSLLFERIFMRKGEAKGPAERDRKGDYADATIEDKTICSRKTFLVDNDHIQRIITDSAWAVATFGAENIVHMDTTQFPIQSFFCTNDGKAYDVTVIYPGVEKPTIQAAFRVFQTSTIPSFENDYINHIAIVYNETGLKAVRDFGHFDYYIMIKNGMKTATLEEL